MTQRGSKSKEASGFISSIWTFPDRQPPSPYRWYGTLPTELTEQLVSMYVTRGKLIVDAFAGAGSVLASAATAGVKALGLDVNPLAVLVARSRLSGAPTNENLKDIRADVTDKYRSTSWKKDSDRLLDAALADGAFDYGQRWFDPTNLRRMWRLLRASGSLHQDLALHALPLACGVVREAASVDSRCTHHLVTKEKAEQDVLALFVNNVQRVSGSSDWYVAGGPMVKCVQGDLLNYAGPPADLAVAHPPYLGVIHYHLIHRLAHDLLAILAESDAPGPLMSLDFQYEKTKAADFSTDSDNKYGEFVATFAEQASELVSADGRLAVIIGDSRHKGMLRHPFTEFISKLEAHAFGLEDLFIWVLQHNGGMHVLRRGNFIDHNYIMVFRKT